MFEKKDNCSIGIMKIILIIAGAAAIIGGIAFAIIKCARRCPDCSCLDFDDDDFDDFDDDDFDDDDDEIEGEDDCSCGYAHDNDFEKE